MSYFEIIILGIIFNYIITFIVAVILIIMGTIAVNTKAGPNYVFMVMEMDKVINSIKHLRHNIKSLKKYRWHEFLPFVSIIFVMEILSAPMFNKHPLQIIFENLLLEEERLEILLESERI